MLALATRLLYLWQVKDSPMFGLLLGDASSYDAWARQIADGDWLGKTVFYQAPLYPYFLGVTYSLFGSNMLAAKVVQAFIQAPAYTSQSGKIVGILKNMRDTFKTKSC